MAYHLLVKRFMRVVYTIFQEMTVQIILDRDNNYGIVEVDEGNTAESRTAVQARAKQIYMQSKHVINNSEFQYKGNDRKE